MNSALRWSQPCNLYRPRSWIAGHPKVIQKRASAISTVTSSKPILARLGFQGSISGLPVIRKLRRFRVFSPTGPVLGLSSGMLRDLSPRRLLWRDTYFGSPGPGFQSGWVCARSHMDSITSSISLASRAKIPCSVNCSVFFNSAADFPALRPCLT